jgi:hypothetical protein
MPPNFQKQKSKEGRDSDGLFVSGHLNENSGGKGSHVFHRFTAAQAHVAKTRV